MNFFLNKYVLIICCFIFLIFIGSVVSIIDNLLNLNLCCSSYVLSGIIVTILFLNYYFDNYVDIKNERGSALVLVVLIVVVISLLSAPFINATVLEARSAAANEQKIKSYYLARSGADVSLEWLSLNLEDFLNINEYDGEAYLYGNLDDGFQASNDEPIDDNSIIVKISRNGPLINIDADGKYSNVTEKVQIAVNLLQQLSIPDFTMAIFASSGNTVPAVELTGSSKIYGDVSINATVDGSVELAWSTNINGDLYVGAGANLGNVANRPENISGDIEYLPEVKVFPDPVFPAFPVGLPKKKDFKTPWKPGLYYEINQDGEYDLIEVTSSRTLTIDLQEGTRIIRVREFKVQGTIELKNVGNHGKLMLYIDEEFSTSGNRDINVTTSDGVAGSPAAFNVFIKGNNSFPKISTAQYKFTGNVFTEYGTVNVRAGSSFKGNIFTGGNTVIISGSGATTNGVIYAPNAEVSIEGGASASGAIVSSSSKVTGNSSATFVPPDPDEIPEEIFTGGNAGNGAGATLLGHSWR